MNIIELEVEQVDRDAAFKYMKLIADHRWSHEAILNGGCDNSSVVRAFAKHRIDAEHRVMRLMQGASKLDKAAANG